MGGRPEMRVAMEEIVVVVAGCFFLLLLLLLLVQQGGFGGSIAVVMVGMAGDLSSKLVEACLLSSAVLASSVG